MFICMQNYTHNFFIINIYYLFMINFIKFKLFFHNYKLNLKILLFEDNNLKTKLFNTS